MEKRETPKTMMFSIVVSIPIVTGTVVLIALVMIIVTRFQGKNLERIPLLTCGVTMLVAGCASLLVTQWARRDKQFAPFSGLIGVTIVMVAPLTTAAVTYVITERATGHLVFSNFVVYYLIYLPVGTWLLLPPKQSQDKCKAEDARPQQD